MKLLFYTYPTEKQSVSFRSGWKLALCRSVSYTRCAGGLRWQEPLTMALKEMRLNALSPNPTKWSNALKQFVSKLLKNCLSVFDHFLGLALKGFALSLVNHFTKTIDHDHEATYLRNFSLVLLDILSVLCSAIIIFIIIIIKTIDIFWRSWQDVQTRLLGSWIFCIYLPIYKNQIIHKK